MIVHYPSSYSTILQKYEKNEAIRPSLESEFDFTLLAPQEGLVGPLQLRRYLIQVLIDLKGMRRETPRYELGRDIYNYLIVSK